MTDALLRYTRKYGFRIFYGIFGFQKVFNKEPENEEDMAKVKRFIHISSQAAVGPSESRTPITEERPAKPLTTYGKSKWESEEECHGMMDKLPGLILILSTLQKY